MARALALLFVAACTETVASAPGGPPKTPPPACDGRAGCVDAGDTFVIELGEVRSGSSAMGALTFVNPADHPPLTFERVTVGAPFAWSLDCDGACEPVTLLPGEQLTVVATYSPPAGASGADLRDLLVTTSRGDITVSFRGRAFTPTLDCGGELTFGAVARGFARTLEVGCTNTSDRAVELQASFTGAPLYRVEPATISLRRGEHVTLSVTFTADGEPSLVYGVLRLSDTGVDPLAVVTLQGEVAGSPLRVETDGCVDFSPMEPLSTRTVLVPVVNLGSTPLTVEVSVAGAAFGVSGSSIVVPPFSSADIAVSATPPDLGLFEGTLTLRAGDDVREVCLSVFADRILTCSGVTLDFGPSAIGVPRVGTIECRNNGATTVRIASVELAGSGDYRIASLPPSLPDHPVALPSASSTSFTVEYTPSDEGADEGTVVLWLLGGHPWWLDVPSIVLLRGEGVAAP